LCQKPPKAHAVAWGWPQQLPRGRDLNHLAAELASEWRHRHEDFMPGPFEMAP
jgi:hypothetical protein